MVPSGTGSGGAKRQHRIGPRHPAARKGHPEHVTRLLIGSRKLRPAAFPTNGGASALDLVGECDQYEAIPPLRSGPRLAHCASLRLRPGYLAEGEGQPNSGCAGAQGMYRTSLVGGACLGPQCHGTLVPCTTVPRALKSVSSFLPLRLGPRLAHCASLRLRPGILTFGHGMANPRLGA